MDRFHAQPVKQLIHRAIGQGLFSCAALSVRRERESVFQLHCGKKTFEPWSEDVHEDALFDLASLTKPLVTAASCMLLVQGGMMSLDEELGRFFSRVPGDKEKISIRHLLSHSGGLRAHAELCQGKYAQLLGQQDGKMERACEIILSMPLEYMPGTRALYSDLGYIILGHIVERLAGVGLYDFVREELYSPLGINGLSWQDAPGFPADSVVPTGYCRVRNRMVTGEVNDANAWFLGGKAGHAGLFGTLEAVDTLLKCMVEAHLGEKNTFPISREVLTAFLRPENMPEGSTWVLGFDTPSPAGSTAGRYFSGNSIGHLGYTGTSFWIDLESAISVVFLSNRTFPFDAPWSRKEMRRFRQNLHDTIRKALET